VPAYTPAAAILDDGRLGFLVAESLPNGAVEASTVTRTVSVGPDGATTLGPEASLISGTAGGFAMDHTGRAYAWSYHTSSMVGEWAVIGSELKAIDADGTVFSYSTVATISAPTIADDGTVYLTTARFGAPDQLDEVRDGRIIALDRSLHAKAAHTRSLPAAPLVGISGEGGPPWYFLSPPLVASDGTARVLSARPRTGSSPAATTVATFGATGRPALASPYRTNRIVESWCNAEGPGVTGCGYPPLWPVTGTDGTTFLALRSGTGPGARTSVVALTPSGAVRSGWPVVFTTAESATTALAARPRGGVVVGRLGPPLPPSERWPSYWSEGFIVALSASGTVDFRTTIVTP
jgi:hypothetical protein